MRCLAEQVGAGLSATVSYIAMLWERRATREHVRNGRGSKRQQLSFAIESVVVSYPNDYSFGCETNSGLPPSQ